MGQRAEAVWRILAAIYGLTIAAIVSTIVFAIGVVWGIVDVIWQLVTDRNDLSEDSTPAMVVGGTLRWNVEMLIFALTGGGPGRLKWLPDF
jgi:hypothetical protein